MKDFFKLINYFFSNYLSVLASIASIIGLSIAVFVHADTAIIGLIFLVLFLSTILIRFFFLVRTFILQKTEKGYHKFATYVRYSTDDAKHISYELHKYLQCKQPIMSEYEHEFYWSGTSEPNITSDIQEYKHFIKTQEGEYDKAIFYFKKPMLYNDFTIIHIKMLLDDEDQKSQTFCEQTIKEPLQLLSFRIELRYANEKNDAVIFKKRMDAKVGMGYQKINKVQFDITSKSYEYTIHNPEVGYYYRIEWDR